MLTSTLVLVVGGGQSPAQSYRYLVPRSAPVARPVPPAYKPAGTSRRIVARGYSTNQQAPIAYADTAGGGGGGGGGQSFAGKDDAKIDDLNR